MKKEISMAQHVFVLLFFIGLATACTKDETISNNGRKKLEIRAEIYDADKKTIKLRNPVKISYYTLGEMR